MQQSSEIKRPPNAGKGRKKGVPNKVTHAAKAAIELAAEELGGAARLTAWARENAANERIFWSQIYPKLLPLQVAGAGEGMQPSLLVSFVGAVS